MKKIYLLVSVLLFATLCFFLGRKQFRQNLNIGQDPVVLSIGEEEEGEYDGARERNELEIEKTKDPALGYIPADRLLNAIRYTDNLKKARLKDATALTWTERGPIFDSVGPTNGNTRGSFAYTSGYMTAVLVDTLNDPTGNTVSNVSQGSSSTCLCPSDSLRSSLLMSRTTISSSFPIFVTSLG